MEKLIEAMSGPYGDVVSVMKLWYEVSVPYVQMEAEVGLAVITWAIVCSAALFLILDIAMIVLFRIDARKSVPDCIIIPVTILTAASGIATLIALLVFACSYSELKTTVKYPEKKAIEQIIGKIRR